MKTVLTLMSVSIFCLAGPAFAETQTSGNNADTSSPSAVTTPPNGYPSSGMSTTSDDSVTSRSSSADKGSHDVAMGSEEPAILKTMRMETALNRLHHINQKEIALAKMAESKAKTPSVLNFAHMLRGDHEKLDKRVQAIADKRKLNLEGFQMATFEKATEKRLDKLSGKEFEQAFLALMEQGHEMAADELRFVRTDLADTEIRGLINEALPQITAHQERSSELDRSRAGVDGATLGE